MKVFGHRLKSAVSHFLTHCQFAQWPLPVHLFLAAMSRAVLLAVLLLALCSAASAAGQTTADSALELAHSAHFDSDSSLCSLVFSTRTDSCADYIGCDTSAEWTSWNETWINEDD
jgi:hypothetical protein